MGPPRAVGSGAPSQDLAAVTAAWPCAFGAACYLGAAACYLGALVGLFLVLLAAGPCAAGTACYLGVLLDLLLLYLLVTCAPFWNLQCQGC